MKLATALLSSMMTSEEQPYPCIAKHILNVIAEIKVEKIRDLALQLDIEEPCLTDIQNCEKEERKPKLVQIWLIQCPQPSWEILIDALLAESMNEGHCVRKIRHHFLRRYSSVDRQKSPLTPVLNDYLITEGICYVIKLSFIISSLHSQKVLLHTDVVKSMSIMLL